MKLFFTAPTKSGVIKEWRIEGWKENYLNMGIGGEIGLYYRSPNAVDTTLSVDYSSIYNDNNVRYFKSLLCDRLNHYSAVADTDMMLMQFDLYKVVIILVICCSFAQRQHIGGLQVLDQVQKL